MCSVCTLEKTCYIDICTYICIYINIYLSREREREREREQLCEARRGGEVNLAAQQGLGRDAQVRSPGLPHSPNERKKERGRERERFMSFVYVSGDGTAHRALPRVATAETVPAGGFAPALPSGVG